MKNKLRKMLNEKHIREEESTLTGTHLKRLNEESGKLKQMGNAEGGRVRNKADAEREKGAI